MKRFFGVSFGLLVFLTSVIGQNVPAKLSPSDEKEANALAAEFFNRFSETLDVTPLIKVNFVSDFDRRLSFCRTTRECEGFGRDFWKGPEQDERSINPTADDYLRQYASAINYFYLYSQIGTYLAGGRKSIDDDIDVKAISSKLKDRLKDQPNVLRWDFFGNFDEASLEPKSISEFREQIAEFEKLVEELRIIAWEERAAQRKTDPKAKFSLVQNDFHAQVEENRGLFFDYPVGTKMIEVWPNEGVLLFFKMDLIKEKGRLKIVAIYPPMD